MGTSVCGHIGACAYWCVPSQNQYKTSASGALKNKTKITKEQTRNMGTSMYGHVGAYPHAININPVVVEH